MLLAVSWLGWSAGIVLGLVFVVAGAAKFAAGARWLTQAADLGVPRTLACAVPWAEITVGAVTAVRLLPPLGPVAILVLLAAFNVLLVVRLRDADRPPCACFGVMSARPLSWWLVARNVGLAVLAVLAIVA